MLIKWLGHSCFYIESADGVRIVTDPYDTTVGYDMPYIEADIVTVSHSHFDHNYTEAINGDFETVSQPGDYNINGITITGISSFHDEVQGGKRGKNTIFKINIDGLNICHMGDIGHLPDQAQLKELGNVDVLLVPVGGIFTVDAEGACEIVHRIKPSVVIPMHYKTPALKFNLGSLELFINKLEGYSLINSDQLSISGQSIRDYDNKLVVLKYL